MKKQVYIKKFNGDVELFSFDKLRNSLHSAGAPKDVVDPIVTTIKQEVYDGMSSNEIYKKAFALLKKNNRISASRYSLKRAIFDLGPTGFPFERLIGALLKEKGFNTEVGVILQGKCVTHEIDVLAEIDNNVYAIECKFHSDPRATSNVRVPLYINSRFLDIQEQWNSNPNNKTVLKQGWLITNTRFTEDAVNYAKCVGLTLLSWDYPKNDGLKANIDSYALYPVTTLTSLTKKEKHELIEKNIVLVKELALSIETLKHIGVSETRIKRVVNEVKKLCLMIQ
ncbi:MAG TPA: restriction endonuclease [Xanthomarina sp.]|nr:restriction endonuclease [Xanthomarina sp.]